MRSLKHHSPVKSRDRGAKVHGVKIHGAKVHGVKIHGAKVHGVARTLVYPEAPSHYQTQLCNLIGCYGNPVKRTSEIVYRAVS